MIDFFSSHISKEWRSQERRALDSESKIKQLLYLIYVQVENDHNFNYMCF